MDTKKGEHIAIIGISCRLPGGIEGPNMLLETALKGKSVVGKVPQDRWNVESIIQENNELNEATKERLRYGGFVHGIDMFDPSFFNISLAEAKVMDPQQRLALEYAYLAFQDAGYSKKNLLGTNTGVFLGIFGIDAAYLAALSKSAASIYSVLGTAHSVAAGRISFALGLEGPSCAYDTACPSSLVALHAAVRSLQHGECDLAVVVGVNIMLDPTFSKVMAVAGLTSPTGKCHTFDVSSDGYCRSEGCGAVFLKRISDTIKSNQSSYAVVRGVAVAQDGKSASLTAPRALSQEKLLRSSLVDAGLKGSQLDYLEAHGTGTNMGDPIEMKAIATVLTESRHADQNLAVGSIKANIGHLESAAGIAGLIHAIMVLRHEKVPPNAELKILNPKVAEVIESLPVVLPTTIQDLRHTSGKAAGVPLIAGISSFGFSGTIANVIIEQSPLHRNDFRRYSRHNPTTEVLFLFTGQGSQYEDMGLELYQLDPVFQNAMNKCDEIYYSLTGEYLLSIMHPSNNGKEQTKSLHCTEYAQPALFALEWSLAQYWDSHGVKPSVVVGHSLGEISAACVADYFTLEDVMNIVVNRAKLMQAIPPADGVMYASRLDAVAVSEAIVNFELHASISIASINGPKSLVLSGKKSSIETLLDKMNVRGKQLNVSRAFHSQSMKGMEESFRKVLDGIQFREGKIKLVSTVNGQSSVSSGPSFPEHWINQITSPVFYMSAVEKAVSFTDYRISTIVEIGPHPVLSEMTKPWLKCPNPITWVSSLIRNESYVPTHIFNVENCPLVENIYQNRKKIPFIFQSCPVDNICVKPCLHDPFCKSREGSHQLDDKDINSKKKKNIEVKQINCNQSQLLPTTSKNIHEDHIESDNIVEKQQINEMIAIVTEIVHFEGFSDEDVLDADLFEMGLDSLATVELLERLNKTMPYNLPKLNMSILFHNHSLRGLIHANQTLKKKTVREKNEDEDKLTTKDNDRDKELFKETESILNIQTVMTPIVQLQTGKMKENSILFLIPGACFSARCFMKFCSIIGPNIPVFGFEDLTLYNIRTPWTSIEEIASEFIKFMRKEQPFGPYKIGGWSMGGIVAYEVMRQLLKSGDRVDSLFLLDASIPAYRGAPIESDIDTASSIFVAHSLGFNSPNVSFIENENHFIGLPQDKRIQYILSRAQKLGIVKHLESAKSQVLCCIRQFQNLIMLAQQYNFPGLRKAEFKKEQYPRIVVRMANIMCTFLC